MKKIKGKLVAILLAVLFLFGCAGTKFYFFGVDAEKLKEMNKLETAAGAVVSIGTHIGGHFLAGALTGNDVKFDGLFNESYERDSWFVDNGGFMLQHGVGLLLTSFEGSRYWDFTNGYVATAALETWTYPLRENKSKSDFRGNDEEFRYTEFGIYSTISLHNLLRTKWHTEKEKAD